MTTLAASPSRTVSEQIYVALKDDLRLATFAPGTALLTRELLARFGCGISPLREALARLVGEGALEARGHRGVRVPALSLTDLNDVYRLRTLLEQEALRLSLLHGDDAWEAGVVTAGHMLERAALPRLDQEAPARSETLNEWERRHRAFHAALVAAAPAPRMLRMIAQMVDQTERYRTLRVLKGDPAALSQGIVSEHHQLLEAAIARRPEVTDMLGAHYEKTRAFIADVLASGDTAHSDMPG